MAKRNRGQTATTDQGETEMSDTAVTDETNEAPPAAEGAAAPAAKKRDELPEGYVTPVGFGHKLKELRGVDIRPQVIYGYVKNNKAFAGFTTKHTDGRNILPVDKGLEWWDAKEKAKAEKAAATPATTEGGDTPPSA